MQKVKCLEGSGGIRKAEAVMGLTRCLEGAKGAGEMHVLCDIPFSILIRIAMQLGRQESGVQHSGERLTPHSSNEHVWRT